MHENSKLYTLPATEQVSIFLLILSHSCSLGFISYFIISLMGFENLLGFDNCDLTLLYVVDGSEVFEKPKVCKEAQQEGRWFCN